MGGLREKKTRGCPLFIQLQMMLTISIAVSHSLLLFKVVPLPVMIGNHDTGPDSGL